MSVLGMAKFHAILTVNINPTASNVAMTMQRKQHKIIVSTNIMPRDSYTERFCQCDDDVLFSFKTRGP